MSRRYRIACLAALFLTSISPIRAQEPSARNQRHILEAVSSFAPLVEISRAVIRLFKGAGGCDPNGVLCSPVPLPPEKDGAGGCDPNGAPLCKP